MVNLSAPQLDRIFHALADATRRQMLAELARGDATVSTLGRPHEMSLVAASKHLRVLEDAGLIRSHKQGRTRTCSINRAAFESAQEILEYCQSFWQQRLDSLESFLGARKKKKNR